MQPNYGIEVRNGEVVTTTKSMCKQFGWEHHNLLKLVRLMTSKGLGTGVRVCEDGFTLDQSAAMRAMAMMDMDADMQIKTIEFIRTHFHKGTPK